MLFIYNILYYFSIDYGVSVNTSKLRDIGLIIILAFLSIYIFLLRDIDELPLVVDVLFIVGSISMGYLLHHKTNIYNKGMLLIFFGAVFGAAIPDYLLDFIKNTIDLTDGAKDLPSNISNISNKLNIFKNIITMVSAGAGGGLLVLDISKNSMDGDTEKQHMVINKTDALLIEVESLKTRLNLLLGSIAVAILIALSVFIYSLLA